MLQSIIFDMDGVLVDSETFWPTYLIPAYESFGVRWSEQLVTDIMGKNIKDIAPLLREKYQAHVTTDELLEVYNTAAKQVFAQSPLRAGVNMLLEDAKASGITMAIGSSSRMEWIQMMLDRHHLHDYFDQLCSGYDLDAPGKPDPAIYNRCMSNIGAVKERTIIFEDSPSGIGAAVASGAIVVATPQRPIDKKLLREAALVVNSIEQAQLPILQSLVK